MCGCELNLTGSGLDLIAAFVNAVKNFLVPERASKKLLCLLTSNHRHGEITVSHGGEYEQVWKFESRSVVETNRRFRARATAHGATFQRTVVVAAIILLLVVTEATGVFFAEQPTAVNLCHFTRRLPTGHDKLHVQPCTPLVKLWRSSPHHAAVLACFLIQHPVQRQFRSRAYGLQASSRTYTTPAAPLCRCGALQLDGATESHLNLVAI